MQDNQKRSFTSNDLQHDEGVAHQGGTGSIVPEDAQLHHRDLDSHVTACAKQNQHGGTVFAKGGVRK